MSLGIFLIILVCVCKQAAGTTTSECQKNGYALMQLEIAEGMIQSAKEKLSTNDESSFPLDCEEILKNGDNKCGVYQVWPKNRVLSGPIYVYCDMVTDGGGWTVIQRRGNFTRARDYFYQNWKAYKEGFGNLKEDFWLGNDYIFALTNQKLHSIRFDLEDAAGNKKHADYNKFWIEEENNNYAVHVAGYSGDAGDSFSAHNGYKFGTKDNDQYSTTKCAERHKGGWWYTGCFTSHLNGEYYRGKTEKHWDGLIWNTWTGHAESLATSEMKIRTNRFWIN